MLSLQKCLNILRPKQVFLESRREILTPICFLTLIQNELSHFHILNLLTKLLCCFQLKILTQFVFPCPVSVLMLSLSLVGICALSLSLTHTPGSIIFLRAVEHK